MELYHYLEEVSVEHRNWRTGKRKPDESDWQDEDGVGIRNEWIKSIDYRATVERVTEALNVKAGTPKFSIILATRNRQQMLDKAIASVLAQTRADWELIVIDNSDERQQIVDDPRIKHHFVERTNIPDLYNQGLAHAKGEIICGLADDDLLPRHALETAGIHLGNADWLVAATQIRDESGNPVLMRGGTRESVEQTRRGTYMLGGAIYWRKSLSDELGGYNEDFDGAGDFDLFTRFLRRSDPVVIPDVLYLYNDWPGTDSRQRAANQSEKSQRIATQIRR